MEQLLVEVTNRLTTYPPAPRRLPPLPKLAQRVEYKSPLEEWEDDLVRRGELCPGCKGIRYVRTDATFGSEEFGKLIPCDLCNNGNLSEYLRRCSGLTGWQSVATMKTYIHTDERRPQYEAVEGLLSNPTGWLTLWGGFGQSKTFLLAAIVNHFLAQKRPAVYVTASKMLDHFRDAYRPEGLGYSAAFDNWSNCYALALDEADKYHKTDWAQDKYRQLLDHRYNLACSRQAITVLACNPQPGSKDWPDELDWLRSRMQQFPIIEAVGGDVRPLLGRKVEI